MKRRLGKIAAAFLVLVLATGAATWAQAQTLTVLHSFSNSPDGALPFAGLLMDAAGNLYSTTYDGGIFGFGTVFKLDSSGNETVLYSFKGGSDGAFLWKQDCPVQLQGGQRWGCSRSRSNHGRAGQPLRHHRERRLWRRL